ncbi:MAG: hypothetical protein GVX96_06570 [Bacteroidetes bacterium]|jgi:hypothetical protein|nr:hypothetical protein [Bacteroidota bacterium]
MLIYSILSLLFWVLPPFLTEPDCIIADFSVQMRTPINRPESLNAAFPCNSQIQVCYGNKTLSIYSRGVEKYSFDLYRIRRITPNLFFGIGSCSSGRRAGIKFHISDGTINWLRIEYPEYDFLHIFAGNENAMKNALFYRRGIAEVEFEIAQFR